MKVKTAEDKDAVRVQSAAERPVGVAGDACARRPPSIVARAAAEGEAIGYDYAAISDHIVEPIDIHARYPYSESGEFPEGSRGVATEPRRPRRPTTASGSCSPAATPRSSTTCAPCASSG